ncbi:GTPase activating protein [Boletus reticuloceps]|uniref:GTPase activating protein n=1 Tax=Boletus reticuloceps TaxID=495285 RepID=A0A8I2YZ91_9AGAM|nr:GTPase activating protein [Boletus reticuloceps]
MSLNESHIPEGAVPREFVVSVELYVPSTAAPGLRKPTVPRRRVDRKEFRKSVSEDVPKKVKEKSSWISLTRSPPGSVQWRPATCKILDEDEHCLLNIYLDETILCQTVYLHMLNHTDIRYADPSLFFRKNCIGISSAGGQRWSSGPGSELIYLHFGDTDACNTWLVLLRSYARAEIYGQPHFPSDGGLYRMWRQVELTVMQGRNFGHQKPFNDASVSSLTLGEDSRAESDPVDLDISCEIHINDNLCGRTTVVKGIGSPDWHENFLFADLPPFEALEVLLWKEKRLVKPTLLGSIHIALTNFRRSEDVEGWFPVIQSSGFLTGIQVGEIRMKLKVHEEIILPHSSYSGMLTVLHSRNVLEWMSDFERKLQLRTLSEQLMFIAIAKGVLVEHLTEYADREVDGTPSSHGTLFRGNTIFTKTMELAMAFYGREFLEASIGRVMRQICFEKITIEVDPNRSSKSPKDVERGVEQLVEWCQTIWEAIYAHRGDCPHEMRRLFEHIRKLVETRYKKRDGRDIQNKELPWQSVSAFCFLRFIVPAILHPHLFGLVPGSSMIYLYNTNLHHTGLPSATVQRSLTLIAKVIQSLANLNVTVQKEEYMRGVQNFLKQNLPAMVDYILVVSTPIHDTYSPHSGHPAFSHQRHKVVNALHQRGPTIPILEREAVPLLPHALDIPRHLAPTRLRETLYPIYVPDALKWRKSPYNVSGGIATDESHPAAMRWDVARPRLLDKPPHSPPSPTSPISRINPISFRRSTAPLSSDQPLSDEPPPTSTHPLPGSSSSHDPSRGDLAVLRRGSVPEISSGQSSTFPEDRVSRTLSRPRFLRLKSVSADSISTFTSVPEPYNPSPSEHLLRNPDAVSAAALDESGKRTKNIFNGLLIRR